MPEFDEYNQLLVTHPFADDSTNKNHDTPVTTPAFSNHHPLRTQSIPSVTVIDSTGETRPGLTRSPTLDELPAEEAAQEVASEMPQVQVGGSDSVMHPVGPNDSFAGVALRYGVSIAALRRANQLWPSDPIHLRTELFIPRGDTLPPRHKSTPNARLETTVKPTPGSSPDIVASSFVATRNMILSILPARISLDSLSSKASASEDLELDDLQSARVLPAADPLFAQEGHELSILRRSAVPLSSHLPCPPTDNNQNPDVNHIPSVGGLQRFISSSRTVSVERLPRMQPFAVVPVRTSQLEPEPAMELPVRLPACNGHDP